MSARPDREAFANKLPALAPPQTVFANGLKHALGLHEWNMSIVGRVATALGAGPLEAKLAEQLGQRLAVELPRLVTERLEGDPQFAIECGLWLTTAASAP